MAASRGGFGGGEEDDISTVASVVNVVALERDEDAETAEDAAHEELDVTVSVALLPPERWKLADAALCAVVVDRWSSDRAT